MTTLIRSLQELESIPKQKWSSLTFFFDSNAVIYHPKICLEIISQNLTNKRDHFRISDVVLREINWRLNHGFGEEEKNVNRKAVQEVIFLIEKKFPECIIREDPQATIKILETLKDLTSKHFAYTFLKKYFNNIITEISNPKINIENLARLFTGNAFPYLEREMLSSLNGRMPKHAFITHLENTKKNILNSINAVLRGIYEEVNKKEGGPKDIEKRMEARFSNSLAHDIRIASHFLVYESGNSRMVSLDKDVQELIDLFILWRESKSLN